MTVRGGIFTWPGVLAPISGTYTASQGITPGAARLVTAPQQLAPADSGLLTITDGVETIPIIDCKATQLTVDTVGTPAGEAFVWTLIILDRRWKWKELGGISGEYNQLDDHGKLIPWTIRSPTELVLLCLAEMGETAVVIDMPPGLTQADGLLWQTLFPPWIGVTPVTGTNPPVNWTGTPPAAALANLCEKYGRRIVPSLSTNALSVLLPGTGADLPPGSIAKLSPSINSPQTPTGVLVLGSPTIFQDRLPMEPVGLEWDGSFRPIDTLSYAPIRGRAPQTSQIVINKQTYVNGTEFAISVNGEEVSFFTPSNAPNDIAAGLSVALLARSNNNPTLAGLTFSSSGNTLKITGAPDGTPFGVSVVASPADAIEVFNLRGGRGVHTWDGADVPTFDCVLATAQLTKQEARRLAQQSVFRCYRISGPDPNTLAQMLVAQNAQANIPADNVGNVNPYTRIPIAPAAASTLRPINVQGYGLITRRQQIVLLGTKVEQITPQANDAQALDRAGNPISLNFYNGYSRDKPAICYGAIAKTFTGPFFIPRKAQNSNITDPIFEPFSIDAVQQVITFNRPIYLWDGPVGAIAPLIQLETGFHIRDPDTNALDAFTAKQFLPGMRGITNFAVKRCDDVQLSMYGTYDAQGNPLGAQILEADPIARAAFYLAGMAAQYFTAPGLTYEYNGFRALALDGAIMQLTWSFDEGGCKTVASRNTEHSVYVPPYPARRRAEFLQSLNNVYRAEAGAMLRETRGDANPYTPFTE